MKTIISYLIFAVLLFGSSKANCQQSKPEDTESVFQHNLKTKPNIIFILTDDMGWGDLGVFYQNQRQEHHIPYEMTPHLDLMAREGAQLRDHYDAAPVCAPSRASILLGLSQGHANVRDNQFDKALAYNHTLGTVLQKLGYSTAVIGKWGEQGAEIFSPDGSDWQANPLNRGFDYFFGYMRHVDGHQHYPKEGIYKPGPRQVWLNHMDVTPEMDKCYTADLWTAAAKHWIIDHEKNNGPKKPFMLYLAYDTPHAILELPTQEYPSGGGLQGGIQWIGKPGHMINTASGKIDSWIDPAYADATYDDDNNAATADVPWPATYKRYATDISRIDNCVGDLLKLLKDLNIDKNTLVVFTSDNGPSKESYLPEGYVPNNPSFFRSFGPFDGIKRDCWEGGERVPAIAFWPGRIPPAQVIKSPSISYDWLATFTDAAGMPAPEESDGVSLLPELTGQGKQVPPNIYVEYFHDGKTPDYKDFAPYRRGLKRGQMQMLRIGDYVGVRYNIKSADDNFEIYNVAEDPEELHNLASESHKKLNIESFTKLSYRLPAEITIDQLQDFMKKRVLRERMPNTSAPRPYDNMPIPSVQNNDTTSGVEWKLYKGVYPWVPQLANLSPADSGYASEPSLNMLKDNKNAVVCFKGYINVPADGKYTFFMNTDTGAELRIHDATVVDADYDYWSGVWKRGEILLKAGLHPFRLYYRRAPKIVPPSLKLEWKGPDIKRKTIPASIFSCAK